MKILFVHLSDIHIDKEFDINSTKNLKLIETIKSDLKDVDECVLICTGDLAFSANVDEYVLAKRFFGLIQTKLGQILNKYIPIVCVPGNHDLDLGDERGFDEIYSNYKNKNIKSYYESDLIRNKNFFNYIENKNCFNDSKIISVRVLSIGGVNIRVNMLNTSPLSTLINNDKELHYIPSREIARLKRNSKAELNISLMHHSVEHFADSCKAELENNLLLNSDLIFLGHEHKAAIVKTKDHLDREVVCFKGGEYSGRYSDNSEFLDVVFDVAEKKYINRIYKWNENNNIFVNRETETIDNVKNNILLNNNEEFSKSFYDSTDNASGSSMDCFVLPLIKNTKGTYEKENKEKYLNEEEFFELLKNTELTQIVSKPDYGKTTLLKYIYKYYQTNGFIPIFLDTESFYKKKDKIIKYAFENQYGSREGNYDFYKQQETSKKILIIDNIDRIPFFRKIDNFKYIEREFAYVICSMTKQDAIDLEMLIEDRLEREKKINSIEITGFYYRKRKELIKKACSHFGIEDDEVDNLTNKINEYISKNVGIIDLSPNVLMHYIKYFTQIDDSAFKKEVIFYEIFQTNIINMLKEKINDVDIKEYLMQLEEIAYYIHFNKKTHISINELHCCYEKYDKEYQSHIDQHSFLETLIKCNIISNRDDMNKYRFANNTYLAYFVARRINNEINNGSTFELGKKSLDIVTENICFGINDKILMFLADVRNNTDFITNLCHSVNKLMSQIPEINLSNPNLKLIERMNSGEISIATSDETKKIEERTEKNELIREREKNLKNTDPVHCCYDENQKDELKYKILKVYKYIDIISKSYASMYSVLKKDKKKEIMKTLLIIPNKLIYSLICPIDKDFDNYVDGLVEAAEDMGIEGFDRIKVENLIIDISRAMILSVYDNIAYNCTTKNTARDINMKEYDDISNKIFGLMMLSFSNDTELFVDEAIRLYKKNDSNKVVCAFIKLIFRVYLIRNEKIKYRIKDRIASEIFNIEQHNANDRKIEKIEMLKLKNTNN